MKRSLVMLLVVALLAMMLPSFALAADTDTTITLSKDSVTTLVWYNSNSWTTEGLTFSVKNFTDEDGYNNYGYLRLESEDSTIVYTDDDYTYVRGDVEDYYIPSFRPQKVGTVKLKVVLSDYDRDEIYATTTLTVEVKKAPATTALKFDPATFEAQVDDSVYLADSLSVTPTDAYYGTNVKWSVDDETKAKVDKYGNVIALAAGTVKVTATALDNAKATATATITIKAKEEEKKEEETAPTLSFSTKSFTLENNTYLSNYLLVENPVDGDEILWTSSDPSAVNVSETNGYVYLYKADTKVTITARSKKFPAASASCTVTYVKSEDVVEDFSFSNLPTSVPAGDSINLMNYLNTKPYDFADEHSNWLSFKSSNPQVASVDDGWLYGHKLGEATITAYATDKETLKREFKITVVAAKVAEVKFGNESYTVNVGKTLSLNDYYTVSPKEANASNTTWTTSDVNIATVYNGRVYGQKAGTATITLTVRNDDDTIVTASTNVTVTDYALSAIAFKKSAYTLNLSYKKDYKRLTLELTPADADLDEDDLYVSSGSPKYVTAGNIYRDDDTWYLDVYGVKPGSSTITIKSHSNPNLKATTKVTVKPVELTSVKAYDSKVTVPLYAYGANQTTLKLKVTPSDAYCVTTWKTSDAGVAYVENREDNDSRYATLQAVAPGTAKITATVTDGKTTKKVKITVTVKNAKVAKLGLNKTKATGYIIKGGENTLQLTATDTTTDYEVPVTWKSSNKKIATVTKQGLVKFVKAGKVKITATTKDGNKTKKTCTLTIKKLKVTSVKAAKKSLSMKAGDTATLKVTVKPAKAYNPAVSFKSSNKKVVTVDSEGNLTALKAGKAVITITAKDGSKKSAKVTVTVKGAANNADDELEIVEGEAVELTLDDNVLEGIDEIEAIEEVAIDDLVDNSADAEVSLD